jgi:predicted dehydrogenase
VGVIGAGHFATRVLLPALAADERVRFAGVCSAGGLTAREVAKRFGFAHATSDAEGLIDDPDIDGVVIATRHDSHAELTARALRRGKAVFCEKPLAISWPGLEDVAESYAASAAPLFVGFNRRFSPLVATLRDALPHGAPRAIVCRVNAGPLPAEHWLNDPIAGGGRIVGELCHFLDLACHFAEGRPIRVHAEGLGGAGSQAPVESVVVQVAFADGSVASLQYLANGDTALAKERLEVFCGGVAAVLDDFRRLEIFRDGKRRVHGTRRQEKGHREEMRAFVDVVAGGVSAVATPEDLFWSSALALQVPAALGGGQTHVDVPRALGGAGAGGQVPLAVPDEG